MRDDIPAATLAIDVAGPGVVPQSLGELISAGPKLLVFLRHFG